MRTNNLTVDTTAVQVPLGKADRPVLVNVGSTNVYFGNSDQVTAANGLPLPENIGYSFDATLQDSEWVELWVIGDAPGGEIRYGSVG